MARLRAKFKLRHYQKAARLAIIRHILQQVAPPEVLSNVDRPDPDVLFSFEEGAIHDRRLAP